MGDWLLAIGIGIVISCGCAVHYFLGRASAFREVARTRQQLAPAAQAAIKTDCLTVSDWVKWNPWYLQDEAWRLEAQAIHLQRQQTHPGEPLEVNLVHVAQEMRRRHGETIAPTLN